MSSHIQLREIEALAASILAQSKSELESHNQPVSTPPVPVVELCILRGLTLIPEVRLKNQNSKLSGLLRPVPPATIYYEATDILGRQHFTIAHELGHFVIHWPQIKHEYLETGKTVEFVDPETVFTRLLERPQDNVDGELLVYERGNQTVHTVRTYKMEVEANYFANFLIMPEDLVLEASEALTGLPYKVANRVLAQQFEVSESAMDLRLKQLRRKGKILAEYLEGEHERKFFRDLGMNHELSTNDTEYAITVSPESQLRTLIAEADQLSIDNEQIRFDFRPFKNADLNLLGVAQSVELALLQDYILESKNSSYQSKSLRRCILPDQWDHLARHLGRLGLLSHIDLEVAAGQYLAYPQALINGRHILLKLTSLNETTDLESVGQRIRDRILEWGEDATDIEGFSSVIGKAVFQLAQDVVLYSSNMIGCGTGYVAVECQKLYENGEPTSYQIVIAVGDLGLSMVDRLRTHFQGNFSSAYDAIEAYCIDHNDRAGLLREIAERGGYLQLNSGDVNYHMGRGSTTFITGLHPVPGLQITAVLHTNIERGN